MSAWSRLLAALDAPQFCGVCGEPIRVERHGGYDRRTGADKPYWVWRCPEISLDVDIDGRVRRAEWRGGDSHDYGNGRPRWHRALAVEVEL